MPDAIVFRTGRKRPPKLTNKNCCHSDREVRQIDTKPESDLEWRDFSIIFAISGCTAVYDEQVYYLPAALRYLKSCSGPAPEIIPHIVYFVSNHAERLRDDRLLEPSLAGLWTVFREWTSEFKVVHFDEEACRAKGWGLDHSDYVKNSDAVRDLIDALLRYHVHREIATQMVLSWLGEQHRPEDSAWLLEFANEERHSYAYYSREYPGQDREHTPTRFAKSIYEIVSDTALLQQKLDEIGDTVIERTTSPTYWEDLAQALELKL